MSIDLRTSYMGLELTSPIVISACPISESLSNIARMEEMGAGAVVLFSLFEEQIRKEHPDYHAISERMSAPLKGGQSYFPETDQYRVGPQEYLKLIQKAKKKVDMPIIASLNGVTDSGWIEYASQMENAGADGIELNVYLIPADPRMTSEEVEKRYLHIVGHVKASVNIPVAVKLNPYFSSLGNMAWRVSNEGADALVLFNRFYQPDFDINELKIISDLALSVPNEIRLPLLWISLLYKKFNTSLAATTGVQGGKEIIKYILAGADVIMTASALYKYGLEFIRVMTEEITSWMEQKGFEHIEDFRGLLSQQNVVDTTAFERANYIKIVESI